MPENQSVHVPIQFLAVSLVVFAIHFFEGPAETYLT